MTAAGETGRSQFGKSLDANFREFEILVAQAKAHERGGRLEVAAVYIQLAAEFAWLNPTGIFASSELEALAVSIALRIPPAEQASVRSSDPDSVLHVITQVYQTGGSTQVLTSWLEQDLGRRHTICLTRQSSAPIPEKVTSRRIGSTEVVRLDRGRGGLLTRARTLRNLAATSQMIVLHPHPYDVVPILALAGQTNLPPVIFVDHADHVFWLGTSVAQTLMSMRTSGAELAVKRRGVEAERSTLMARPLRPVDRESSRADAKALLGLPADQTLVVTAADGAKYRPVSGPSLLEMIMPVFREQKTAAMVAAGPSAEGEWLTAERETDGRVQAIGRLPDVSVLQQAADIYLDSFPFSSLTSLLEAGSFSTPVVTYRGHPESCAVLGADTHGLDELMVRPNTPDQLRTALAELLGNEAKRAELGALTRDAIQNSHIGDGWRKGVSELYEFAAAHATPPSIGEASRQVGALDEMVELVMSKTQYSEGSGGAIRNNMPLLPATQRIIAAGRLLRSRQRVPARSMAPEWSLPKLAQLRRSVGTLRQRRRSSSS